MMMQIGDSDELYRRVMSYHVKPDDTISSAAFRLRSRQPDPECSVYLARLTTPEEVLTAGLPGQRLAGIPTHKARSLGLIVVHDPQRNEPAHCLIRGLTKQLCSRLAEAAYIVGDDV